MRPIPIIVFAVCAVAAVGLYLGFSFLPDQHRIGAAEQILSTVRKETDQLSAVSSRLPAVQAELGQTEAQRQAAVDGLMPKESVAGASAWLRTAPRRNGLAGTVSFGSLSSNPGYRALPFQLMVSGSISGLKRFFAECERQLKGWGINQVTVFWEDSGLIRATIRGAFYIEPID